MVCGVVGSNMDCVLNIILLVEELVRLYRDTAREEHGAHSEQCKTLERELEVSSKFSLAVLYVES